MNKELNDEAKKLKVENEAMQSKVNPIRSSQISTVSSNIANSNKDPKSCLKQKQEDSS